MMIEVSKVLRLPGKLQRMFWKRRKSIAPATQNDFRHVTKQVWMCHACHAKRSNGTCATSKSDPFAELTTGTSIWALHGRPRTVANGCGRLRTVADGCGQHCWCGVRYGNTEQILKNNSEKYKSLHALCVCLCLDGWHMARKLGNRLSSVSLWASWKILELAEYFLPSWILNSLEPFSPWQIRSTKPQNQKH